MFNSKYNTFFSKDKSQLIWKIRLYDTREKQEHASSLYNVSKYVLPPSPPFQFIERNIKFCARAGTKLWLQEGNTVKASCFRTRPETALNAAADPKVASSVRHGTVWPFDPRYQLHQIYRTHRTAISKCSTLPGTEESTRASKESDNNRSSVFHEFFLLGEHSTIHVIASFISDCGAFFFFFYLKFVDRYESSKID